MEHLREYGYRTKDDSCFVQCFDAAECRRIRIELSWEGRLVQLIGDNDWGESTTDYDALRTSDGLKQIADYADGIGPTISHTLESTNADGHPDVTELVERAHRLGLVVHPYTARADDLPNWAANIDVLLTALYREAGVDGLFCDFPDHAVRVRDALIAQK